MSLIRKTVKNIGFVATVRIISVFLNAITTIVLARLLIPEYFGIVAIAMFLYTSIDTLAEFGMGTAIIQRKHEFKEAMNTAFTLRIILSIVLFIVFLAIAPVWSMFFGIPDVMYIMWFIAITMLIANFGFGPRVSLQKSLEFDKIATPEFARHISYSLVTIILAILGFGYWSLAAGIVLSTLVNIVGLNIVHPMKLQLKLDRRLGSELLNFGKYVIGSALIIFVITNLDDIVVGKAFGVIILGLYVMAWKWANLSTTHITQIVNRVMFPTYARIQDDKKRLRMAFLLTLKYVSIITIPINLGLLMIAPYFTEYVLGEIWIPATVALQILCFYGLERSLSANCGSVFNAIGRPEILFNLSLASLISKVTLFFVLLPWGIEGIALAMASTSAVICIANLYYAGKFTKSNVDIAAKYLLIPFIASLVMMSIIVLLIFSNLFIISGVVPLLIIVGLGAIIYFGVVYSLDKKSIMELLKSLKITK